jgi:ubiquinone biosynthesis protein
MTASSPTAPRPPRDPLATATRDDGEALATPTELAAPAASAKLGEPPPPGTVPATEAAGPAGVEPRDLLPAALDPAPPPSHSAPVSGRATLPSPAAADDEGGFEPFVEGPPPTLLRRFRVTHRHFLGLLFGGLQAWLRDVPRTARRGARFRALQLLGWLTRPALDPALRDLPFPVQLRRRLEILGPTYIKLGQILSLREDILPRSVTGELKHLLDRLPAVSYERYLEIVAGDLGRDPLEVFADIDRKPLGSASIGQTHRARLHSGETVIIKAVKPGIRETLRRDVVLLRFLGRILQLFAGRFQPKRVIDEFCHYTLREVDLRLEGENAETFSANFRDEPDIVFPKIYRHLTGPNVLVMEFFDGWKPDSPKALEMSKEDRDRVIDLGAAAIIRMLYRDGFFHADLHPGNLIILPGPKAGFIDLGMVGRFDEELKRTMLYYYYCLVTGDAENAARYLSALAETGGASNPKGFQRAVEEVCRRWARTANFDEFSLGQLILESVGRGGQFHMYFPVEMVLMVKAIVTFEGVGQLLEPGFDVAKVSQKHINRVFIHQFSPLRMARESLRGAPELVDALVKMPMLVTQGLRALDKATRQHPENPFAGVRGTLLGGFCILAGAILAAFQGPWPLYVALFLLGLALALRKGA